MSLFGEPTAFWSLGASNRLSQLTGLVSCYGTSQRGTRHPQEGYDQNRKKPPLPPFPPPLGLQLEQCVWSCSLCCQHTHGPERIQRRIWKWPHRGGTGANGETAGLGCFDLKTRADGSWGGCIATEHDEHTCHQILGHHNHRNILYKGKSVHFE